MSPFNQIRIIGVGNEFRGDDAAGLLTARRLRERLNGEVSVLERSGEGSALMDSWAGAECVILIDAIQSSHPIGSIHRFDAGKEPLPEDAVRCSTHSFGVTQCIELARAMNKLPARLIFYGIVGKNFEMGAELSPEVEKSIQQTAQDIYSELIPARHPDHA